MIAIWFTQYSCNKAAPSIQLQIFQGKKVFAQNLLSLSYGRGLGVEGGEEKLLDFLI